MKIYENILVFRTLKTQIRTWVEREADGPCPLDDFAEINEYIAANRQRFDSQRLIDAAEDIAKKFPRISAIEVMQVSMNAGVLIYPRWP